MTYLIHVLTFLAVFLCGMRHERARWTRKPNEIATARSIKRWAKERAKANPNLRALDGGRRG